MQEEGAAQSPPFAILGRRAEVGTPSQLNAGLGMPEAGARAEHEHEDQQIGADEQQSDGEMRRFGVQVVVKAGRERGGVGHGDV